MNNDNWKFPVPFPCQRYVKIRANFQVSPERNKNLKTEFYLNLERRLAEGEGFFFLTLPAPDWSPNPVPWEMPEIPGFRGIGVRPTGFACKIQMSR